MEVEAEVVEENEEEKKEEEKKNNSDKSNHPHLAGGEQEMTCIQNHTNIF
jgi:hypothetical protein